MQRRLAVVGVAARSPAAAAAVRGIGRRRGNGGNRLRQGRRNTVAGFHRTYRHGCGRSCRYSRARRVDVPGPDPPLDSSIDRLRSTRCGGIAAGPRPVPRPDGRHARPARRCRNWLRRRCGLGDRCLGGRVRRRRRDTTGRRRDIRRRRLRSCVRAARLGDRPVRARARDPNRHRDIGGSDLGRVGLCGARLCGICGLRGGLSGVGLCCDRLRDRTVVARAVDPNRHVEVRRPDLGGCGIGGGNGLARIGRRRRRHGRNGRRRSRGRVVGTRRDREAERERGGRKACDCGAAGGGDSEASSDRDRSGRKYPLAITHMQASLIHLNFMEMESKIEPSWAVRTLTWISSAGTCRSCVRLPDAMPGAASHSTISCRWDRSGSSQRLGGSTLRAASRSPRMPRRRSKASCAGTCATARRRSASRAASRSSRRRSGARRT